MAPRYLLDTNICIYALSGRHARLRHTIDQLASGQAIISVIVYGELQFGIAKSTRKNDAQVILGAFITQVPVQPMPIATAEHYGDIRANLARQGTPIGANDLWIAAHARAAGLAVVTNDVKEFRRVKGLKVANWL